MLLLLKLGISSQEHMRP